MTSEHTCRICGDDGQHITFMAKEMMFGMREPFEYFQCRKCGCLQIAHIPDDLGRFYPENYYSISAPPWQAPNFIKSFLLKQRFRSIIFNHGFKIGRLVSKLIPTPNLKVDEVIHVATILQTAGVKSFSARFLDIGCGNSSTWLSQLKTMGFKNLTGIDPHIREDKEAGGIRIFKGTTEDVCGEYDLISFHHSLEHIPDQIAALNAARRLLSPNGTILVRIPVVSSTVWNEYGTDWVELDAPRHLYLHSDESIALCAENTALRLLTKMGDSLDFEFYGSEQYRRDIPLMDSRSYWLDRSSPLFSTEELDMFRQRAEEVNLNGHSGRACFFFKQQSHERP